MRSPLQCRSSGLRSDSRARPAFATCGIHIDLGPSNGGFNTVVLGHGVRLLKVVGSGHAAPPRSQSYEAEAGTLSGGAAIAACTPCSGGFKVGDLGLGANSTVTINNVNVDRDSYYRMQIDSMTIEPRALSYQVNGGPFQTLNAGGGSFFIPASSTVPVKLNAGSNSILFGNPTIHRTLTG
jgi:alpha-galactosidase